MFGPVESDAGADVCFLGTPHSDADASFRRRACARNKTQAVVNMAEAPIGQWTPSSSKLMQAGCADNLAVLDGGTGFLKVGYAAQVHTPIPKPTPCWLCDTIARQAANGAWDQNFPEHQFPSIVGRPILRSEERDGNVVVKDIMCGDEAAAARSMLQITYPVRLATSPTPVKGHMALLRRLLSFLSRAKAILILPRSSATDGERDCQAMG